jgi:hypothetical protein
MKMPAIIAAIVALSAIAATPARALDDEQWRAQVDAATDIETLAKLYLELMVESNPVQGTQLGIHGTAAESTR